MGSSRLSIEEVTTPEAVEAAHTRAEQGGRNAAWLESHWEELLPEARGKFVAVAGGEGIVAETVDAAWKWIDGNHPADGGAFVQYVPSVSGPRIYANRRRLAYLR